MKLKSLFVAAAIAAAVVPAGFARATVNCDTAGAIYVFSNITIKDPTTGKPVTNPATGNPAHTPTVEPGIVGCTVDPTGSVDTQYIYPGSDTLQVRWTGAGQPMNGTITFNGTTTPLTFSATALTGGGTAWDTGYMTIDQAASVTGGDAVITITVDDEPVTATWHTVG